MDRVPKTYDVLHQDNPNTLIIRRLRNHVWQAPQRNEKRTERKEERRGPAGAVPEGRSAATTGRHRRIRDKPLLPMAQKKFHRQQKRPETLPMAPTSTPSAAPAVAGGWILSERSDGEGLGSPITGGRRSVGARAASEGARRRRDGREERCDDREAPAKRSAAAVPWGCRGMVSVGAQRRGGVWGVPSPMNRSR